MTPITEVADQIRARPAPVLIVDTCNFLDLFRVARPTKDTPERRVDLAEVRAAVALRKLLDAPEPGLHHIVPELVPGEFRDNATEKVEYPFQLWLDAHNDNQRWLAGAAEAIGHPPPTPVAVLPHDLCGHLRQVAERLLATATILARDGACLDRAVSRLVGKRRPSHRKEMKDSMNLEQALELARLLASGGAFEKPVWFVSSNTNDFAQPSKSKLPGQPDVHPDLKADFDSAGLTYLTSLSAVLGILKDLGQDQVDTLPT